MNKFILRKIASKRVLAEIKAEEISKLILACRELTHPENWEVALCRVVSGEREHNTELAVFGADVFVHNRMDMKIRSRYETRALVGFAIFGPCRFLSLPVNFRFLDCIDIVHGLEQSGHLRNVSEKGDYSEYEVTDLGKRRIENADLRA